MTSSQAARAQHNSEQGGVCQLLMRVLHVYQEFTCSTWCHVYGVLHATFQMCLKGSCHCEFPACGGSRLRRHTQAARYPCTAHLSARLCQLCCTVRLTAIEYSTRHSAAPTFTVDCPASMTAEKSSYVSPAQHLHCGADRSLKHVLDGLACCFCGCCCGCCYCCVTAHPVYTSAPLTPPAGQYMAAACQP
jgi:hypothetical protein